MHKTTYYIPHVIFMVGAVEYGWYSLKKSNEGSKKPKKTHKS